MDSSPGVAITISLVLAIVLSACPVAGAFSIPASGISATGIIAGLPGQADNGNGPGLRVIDGNSGAKTVHVARGDVLLVHFIENDPNRAWRLSSDGGFKVVSDVVLQTYPARHDFRIKVARSGEIRFSQVDSRDGYVIDTFVVRVIADQEKPGASSLEAHLFRAR